MSHKKTYAVFGLGRYGKAVARELINNGAEVIAVDCDQSVVNEVSDEIPFCKCANITDIAVLNQLGIADVDVVILCMATNLEASILSIMLCKELGVKKIIAKCSSELNYKILKKVGADVVVFPEKESGERLAKNLVHSGLIDILELSDTVSLSQLDIKPEWEGKTLRELAIRRKYSINIVAIREGNTILTDIGPDTVLTASMKLIVIINSANLKKVSSVMEEK